MIENILVDDFFEYVLTNYKKQIKLPKCKWLIIFIILIVVSVILIYVFVGISCQSGLNIVYLLAIAGVLGIIIISNIQHKRKLKLNLNKEVLFCNQIYNFLYKNYGIYTVNDIEILRTKYVNLAENNRKNCDKLTKKIFYVESSLYIPILINIFASISEYKYRINDSVDLINFVNNYVNLVFFVNNFYNLGFFIILLVLISEAIKGIMRICFLYNNIKYNYFADVLNSILDTRFGIYKKIPSKIFCKKFKLKKFPKNKIYRILSSENSHEK